MSHREAFHKNQNCLTEKEQAKARRLLRENPDLTKTALAKRFGVSTVILRRLLNQRFDKAKP